MKLNVTVASASYDIHIGTDLSYALTQEVQKLSPEKIIIISDSNVQKLWGARISRTLKSCAPVEMLSFTQGEKNKTQKVVTNLQHAMLKSKTPRKSVVIALGGGVVGDVAGFVAATYMRGVPFIQVPTTLLAMVDSSIGGKVGIDTPYGKNMVGAFHQPKAVIVDLQFLNTLPELHIVNGLMESIKMFLTSDASMIPSIEHLATANLKKLDDQTLSILEKVIARSLKIKADVVMNDEFEQGERKILNFGHTIGHALELVSKFKIPHGYAVGYGMIAETAIAQGQDILRKEDRDTILILLSKFGIRTDIFKKYKLKSILEATASDKKTKGGVPHYVLLEGIGSIDTKNGFAHPITNASAAKALKDLLA